MAEIILSIYATGGFIALVLIVYFIYKRIQDRKKENFEKRNS